MKPNAIRGYEQSIQPFSAINADGSRVTIAIIRICDSEIKIAKLGTGIVNHNSLPTN